MKPTSRYANMRAFGVGTVAGCIGGAVLGLVLVHLGAAAFYGLCFAVGMGAWGLAELLDRRTTRRRPAPADSAANRSPRFSGEHQQIEQDQNNERT